MGGGGAQVNSCMLYTGLGRGGHASLASAFPSPPRAALAIVPTRTRTNAAKDAPANTDHGGVSCWLSLPGRCHHTLHAPPTSRGPCRLEPPACTGSFSQPGAVGVRPGERYSFACPRPPPAPARAACAADPGAGPPAEGPAASRCARAARALSESLRHSTAKVDDYE